MCSACEHGIDAEDDPIRIQQWDDQYQAGLREKIRLHGWAVQAVYGDPSSRRPPFAYTIGLTRFGHPELVVFGLHQAVAAHLLNTLGNRARAGLPIASGSVFAAGAAGPRAVRAVRLPNPEDVLLNAVSRYGPRVTALQVVVADENDVFPGEPGFQGDVRMQPPPGSFAA